jgi:hypothetical protein
VYFVQLRCFRIYRETFSRFRAPLPGVISEGLDIVLGHA